MELLRDERVGAVLLEPRLEGLARGVPRHGVRWRHARRPLGRAAGLGAQRRRDDGRQLGDMQAGPRRPARRGACPVGRRGRERRVNGAAACWSGAQAGRGGPSGEPWGGGHRRDRCSEQPRTGGRRGGSASACGGSGRQRPRALLRVAARVVGAPQLLLEHAAPQLQFVCRDAAQAHGAGARAASAAPRACLGLGVSSHRRRCRRTHHRGGRRRGEPHRWFVIERRGGAAGRCRICRTLICIDASGGIGRRTRSASLGRLCLGRIQRLERRGHARGKRSVLGKHGVRHS